MNKKLVCGLFFLFSAALIVRPVIRSVNVPAGKAFLIATPSNAEGDPMPSPSGPHKAVAGLLAVEGDPMPDPRGPHKPGAGLLAAEGDPMPSPSGPHVATVA